MITLHVEAANLEELRAKVLLCINVAAQPAQAQLEFVAPGILVPAAEVAAATPAPRKPGRPKKAEATQVAPTEPASAVEAVPSVIPGPAPASAPIRADLDKAAHNLAAQFPDNVAGFGAIKAVLAQFGASRMSDVPVDKYPDVIKAFGAVEVKA